MHVPAHPAEVAALRATLSAELAAFADALLDAALTHRALTVPDGLAQRCTVPEARAIAALNTARLIGHLGGGLAGAKLAATNPAMLARLGLERPLVGPILSARLHVSPVTLPRSGFISCVVEPELGVRFGADLDGRAGAPSRAALLAAVDAVFPVIELAESRYTESTAAPPVCIEADLAYAGALVVGADCAGWRDLDLAAATVRLTVNGEAAREGAGAAVMGHPFDALADYVADMGRRGRVVRAGEIVSTGTWTPPWQAGAGEHIVADFGALGTVDVRLT